MWLCLSLVPLVLAEYPHGSRWSSSTALFFCISRLKEPRVLVISFWLRGIGGMGGWGPGLRCHSYVDREGRVKEVKSRWRQRFCIYLTSPGRRRLGDFPPYVDMSSNSSAIRWYCLFHPSNLMAISCIRSTITTSCVGIQSRNWHATHNHLRQRMSDLCMIPFCLLDRWSHLVNYVSKNANWAARRL